jgi:transcriptional regulator with GAF, ATPase, and Fis domain/serine/threonine protein kinase
LRYPVYMFPRDTYNPVSVHPKTAVPYRSVRVCFEGAVSRVAYGVHTHTQQPVSIKTVPHAHAHTLQNTYAHLLPFNHHPHIQHVQRIVHTPQGAWDLVSDWVDGEPLSTPRTYTPQALLEIALQTTWALSALHTHGLVHADVCPKNILYHDGHATLIDFGMSHPWDQPHPGGSVGFIAPEILTQTPSQTCDVYSLGAVLQVLLQQQPLSEAYAPVVSLAQTFTHPHPSKRPLPFQAFEHTFEHLSQEERTQWEKNIYAKQHVLHPQDMALHQRMGEAVLQGYHIPFGILDVGEHGLMACNDAITHTQATPHTLYRPNNPWPCLHAWVNTLETLHAQSPLCMVFKNAHLAPDVQRLMHLLEHTQSGIRCITRPHTPYNLALTLQDTHTVVQHARPLRPQDLNHAQALHNACAGLFEPLQNALSLTPASHMPVHLHQGTLHTVMHTPLPKENLSETCTQTLAFIALMPVSVPLQLLKDTGFTPSAHAEVFLTTHVYDSGPHVACINEETRAFFAPLCTEKTVEKAYASLLLHNHNPVYLHTVGIHTAHKQEAYAPLLAYAQQSIEEGLLQQALRIYALLQTHTPSLEVSLGLAQLHMDMGQYEKALDVLKENLSHPSSHPLYIELLVKKGLYQEACVFAENHLKEHAPSTHSTTAALYCRALLLKGDYALSEQKASYFLKTCTHKASSIALQNTLALALLYQSHEEEAQHTIACALEEAHMLQDASLLESTCANAALVYQKCRCTQKAEDLYAWSLAEARKKNDTPREVLRLTNMATLAQDTGAWNKALHCYTQAQQKALLCQGHRESVRILLNHANLLCFIGHFNLAHTLLEDAFKQAQQLQMEVEKAYLHLVASETALGLHNIPQAMQHLAHARAFFEPKKNKAALAECTLLQANIHAREGHTSQTLEHAQNAFEQAQDAHQPNIALRALYTCALFSPSHIPAFYAWAQKLQNKDALWAAHTLLQQHPQAYPFFLQCIEQLDASLEPFYLAHWIRKPMAETLHSWKEHTEIPHQEDLEKILSINRWLAQDHDVTRILQLIIDEALAISNAERGFILLNEEGSLRICAERHFSNHDLPFNTSNLSVSIAQNTMLSGEPVTSFNAQRDQRFIDFASVHHLHIKSVLCVPLKTHQGVLGALYLDHRKKADVFSKKHVFLLQAFADQASIALSSARLVQHLTLRTQELEQSQTCIDALNVQLQQELKSKDDELHFIRKMHGTHTSLSTQGKHGMIGHSAAMQQVYHLIDRVSNKDVPVYIHGESGTGKELVARAIHASSHRNKGPFVAVNCGAIPADLLESELFGHEKGSFTGAVRDKPGLFEAAHKGTLFLDEIGDMPLHMQIKILRALQEKSVRRIGSQHAQPIDIRIISATHKDLLHMVKQGLFREDLWYRINVVTISLPPLRDRTEDLPVLIEHLLKKYHAEGTVPVSRAAYRLLLEHPWPGNIRELENEIQRALALTDGTIAPQDFSSELQRKNIPHTPVSSHALKDLVDQFEKETILTRLEENKGKVSRTAETLGLTRAGLYKKLHKYAITLRD